MTPEEQDALYREHLGYVLSILTRGCSYRHAGGVGFVRISSPFDAEDVAQDVFWAFLQQCERGNFDRTQNTRAYLRTLAVRAAAKHLGRSRAHISVDEIQELPAAENDNAELLEAQKLIRELREDLEERERRVLDSYFDQELGTQSEVAKILGLSRDQVARAIISIRKKVSRHFKQKGWLP